MPPISPAPVLAPRENTAPKSDHAWAKALAGELAIMIGGDLVYYTLDGPFSRWPDKWSKDAWHDRLSGRTFGFDSNSHEINAGGHVFGGWAYYLVQEIMFRERDKAGQKTALQEVLKELRAFGFTFSTSAFWELFIEEGQPSKNDQIVTPIAGYSGGKAIARVYRFIADGEQGPHVLEAKAGAATNGTGFVAGRAEVIDGRRSADVRLKASFDSSGFHSGSVFTQAAIAGVSHEKGGFRAFGGISSAYDYSRQEPRPGVQRDKLGVVEIVELTGDVGYAKDGFSVRGTLDVGVDFAMVQAHALDAWRKPGHDTGRLKPTLDKHGYYYAGGLTLRPELSIGYRGLTLSAGATHHRFDSIEGHSRNQAGIKNDLDIQDQATSLSLGASYRYDRLQLSLGYDVQKRAGRIGDTQVESRTSSWNAGVGFTF